MSPTLLSESTKLEVKNLDLFYGQKRALNSVSMKIPEKKVTAFIGPSGCGKSTFLRSLNRMNDTVASARVTGTILLDGEDIYAPSMDVVQLRARVGMVFQKPNPFPKSIYENVAYGLRVRGESNRHTLAVIGDGALTGGMAWEALNNIAAEPDLPLVIVVNDNERSYTPTIGGLATALTSLRTNPRYEQVLDLREGQPFAHWCVGGTTNVVLNCIDRWRGTARYTQPALVWEGEDGAETTWTFADLDREMAQLYARVLEATATPATAARTEQVRDAGH